MRRHDREVTGLENILAILDKCEVVRLGLCTDNMPYIVPLNFGYETDGENVFIYMHSAKEGKKINMLAKNPNVCFEADCSFKVLAADTPCGYTAEYQSVTGEGTIELLNREAEKIKGLDAIMKKYDFKGKPHYKPQELAAVAVLKVSVTSITGKAMKKK